MTSRLAQTSNDDPTRACVIFAPTGTTADDDPGAGHGSGPCARSSRPRSRRAQSFRSRATSSSPLPARSPRRRRPRASGGHAARHLGDGAHGRRADAERAAYLVPTSAARRLGPAYIHLPPPPDVPVGTPGGGRSERRSTAPSSRSTASSVAGAPARGSRPGRPTGPGAGRRTSPEPSSHRRLSPRDGDGIAAKTRAAVRSSPAASRRPASREAERP